MSRLACLIVAAILPALVQAEDTLADHVSSHLAKWDALGIDSYTFNVWWAGTAKGRLGPARIVVRNGKIVSAHYLVSSTRRDSQEPASDVGEGPEVEADSWLRKTIPQLFALASEAVKSGGKTTLMFDEHYGFPAEIFNRPPNADAFLYKVYDFAVLE